MAALTVEEIEVVLALRDKAQKDLEKAKGNFKKFVSDIKGFGTGLTTLTAPIAAIGGFAVKAAMDFETSFASVKKVLNDVTNEDLAALEARLRNIAANEMPIDVNALTELASIAGQLGIEVDNIADFAVAMAKMGNTTDIAASDAALALAQLANITKTAQQDIPKLGSVIVQLGNNLSTTESRILDMATRLAGAGTQIGLAEAEIFALAGAFASVGLSAEVGGTAISRVFSEMDKAVALGGKGLRQFAKVAEMSASGFANAFKTKPMSAVQAFIKGLGTLEDRGMNISVVLSEMGLDAGRLSDVLKRAAGANDGLTKSLELATKEWENANALNEEAAAMATTLKSLFVSLMGSVEDVGITVGKALVPALKDAIAASAPLIEILNSVATWFSNLSPETRKWVVTIGALVTILGPLMIGLGVFLSTLSSLSSVVVVVKGALVLLGAGLSAIGAIPLAIAAAVIGVVWAFRNWDKIEPIVKATWNGIKKWFGDKLHDLVGWVGDATDRVVGFFKDMAHKLVGGSIVPDEIVDPILKLFGNMADGISDDTDRAKNQAVANFERMVSGITGADLDKEIDQLAFVWNSLTDEQKSNSQIVENVLSSYNRLRENAVGPLPDELEQLRDQTFGLSDAFKKQIQISTQLEGWMVTRLIPGFEGVEDSGKNLEHQVIGVTDEMLEMQSTVDGLSGGFSFLGSLFRGIGQHLKGLGSEFLDFKNVTKGIMEGVFGPGGFIANLASKGMSSLIGLVGKGFKKLFGGPSEAELAGRDAWRGYTDGLAKAANSDQIKQALGAGWANVEDAKAWIVLRDAVDRAGGTVTEAEGLWQRYVDAIRQGPEAVASVTAEIDEWLARAEEAEAVLAENKALTEEFLLSQAEGLAGILDAGQQAFSPEQFSLYLDRLNEVGLITDERASQLAQMADDAHTDWNAMEEAARKYGVAMVETTDEAGNKVMELDDSLLGVQFTQAKLSDQAGELAAAWNLLTGEGTDTQVAIQGMTDEAQEFVNQALSMGLSVPESMRPMLEAMVQAGVLTDENGTALEDLSKLNFADPLEDSFGDIADAIRDLISLLSSELTAAIQGIPDGSFTVRAQYDDSDLPRDVTTGADIGFVGEFAKGGRVPKTGFALVHAGEEVLTPGEAARGSSGSNDSSRLYADLPWMIKQALRDGIRELA